MVFRGGMGEGGGAGGGKVGVASSLGALSIYFLLCTDQECRGEAGLGSRGKEQRVGLLLRHLGEGGETHTATVRLFIQRTFMRLMDRSNNNRLQFQPDCWQPGLDSGVF